MRNKSTRNNKRSKYDWQAIRHEYVTSPAGEEGLTLDVLSKKYRCPFTYIQQKAAKESWTKLREGHRRKIAENAQKKAEETAAQRLHRHAQYLRLVQAKAGKAMLTGETVPTPRDGTEAIKAERVLYGEASEHIQIEASKLDRMIAAAYWKARREQMEYESDGD
ncbi:MAG: hypothetical protein WCP22_07875 [Chlamydiota bacterium]